MFYKIQKVYYTLLRFFNKIKYSKIKEFDNKYDLLMNPLNELSENLKLTLIEDNIKYTFRLSDIISIINDNLTNCDNYFSPSIRPIKNPYTNIPFKISNLYNIYFKIKQSNFIMPSLFNNLFIDNFNYSLFSTNNSIEIIDNGIINYYRNVSNNDLYKKTTPFFSVCKIINSGFILNSEYPKRRVDLHI